GPTTTFRTTGRVGNGRKEGHPSGPSRALCPEDGATIGSRLDERIKQDVALVDGVLGVASREGAGGVPVRPGAVRDGAGLEAGADPGHAGRGRVQRVRGGLRVRPAPAALKLSGGRGLPRAGEVQAGPAVDPGGPTLRREP